MRISRSRSVRLGSAAAAMAVAVPAGLALVPASSTSGAIGATAAVAAKRSAPAPASRLLSASEVGNGWHQISLEDQYGAKKQQILDLLNGATVTPASCGSGLGIPAGYEAEAHRVFQKGNSQYGPYLGQAVVRFSNASAAKRAIADARRKVAQCSDVTVETSQGSAEIHIRRMGARAVSANAVAYRVDATLGGIIPVGGQVIAVRRGRLVSVIGHGSVFAQGDSGMGHAKRAAKAAARRL